jgi:hypothetical protein
MDNTTLYLELDELDNDPEVIARDLRSALLERPEVQSVQAKPITDSTVGQKGAEIDWSTLLVTLAASGGVLTTLVTALKAWLEIRQQATIKLVIGDDALTISGRGPYSEEQEQAINRWLNRHKGYVLPHE